MRRYIYGASILICFVFVLSIKTGAQETVQKPNNDEKSKKAPVAFKYLLNYIPPLRSSPVIDPMKVRGIVDLNIVNNDLSRIIQELEYEIYATDNQTGSEIDHIRVIDRTRIKPGELKKRRSLYWKPTSIVKICDPPTKCTLRLRILRIKFDDGSAWQGQIEAEDDKPPAK